MSLVAEGIVSGYGEMEILHGVSLTARAGMVTCVVGPNGSGKSTLLNTIVGQIRAKQGKVSLDGQDITNQALHTIIRKGIAKISQGRTVFPKMSIEDNLLMGAYVLNHEEEIERRLDDVYRMFPFIRERGKELAGNLSGGEQVMVCFARALMTKPRLILMDEPSLGLAPKMLDQTIEKIREINKAGATIVVVEQNVRKVLSFSDYAYVLRSGANVLEGEAKGISDLTLKQLFVEEESPRAKASSS